MKKPKNWMELPFNEKLRFYGLNLTEFHARYADKLNAKEIIKQKAPEIKTAEVIRILRDNKDLKITDQGIIKSAHASGWNIILPKRISSDKLDEIKLLLKRWSRKYKPETEKHYSFIEPKFFIERVLKDKIADSLMVYMIRCINSEPISIGVKYKDIQNSYDLKWNLVLPPKLPFSIPKPEELQILLNVSQRLSKPFEFVRLDYFITTEGIYFSEFTFVPNAGLPVFSEEMEYSLGKLWK